MLGMRAHADNKTVRAARQLEALPVRRAVDGSLLLLWVTWGGAVDHCERRSSSPRDPSARRREDFTKTGAPGLGGGTLNELAAPRVNTTDQSLRWQKCLRVGAPLSKG
jgi:hypothetical protein